MGYTWTSLLRKPAAGAGECCGFSFPSWSRCACQECLTAGIHESRRMEEFPINTPILYPDFLILAALVCPSGLSYSLYVNWEGAQSRITTGLLAVIAVCF